MAVTVLDAYRKMELENSRLGEWIDIELKRVSPLWVGINCECRGTGFVRSDHHIASLDYVRMISRRSEAAQHLYIPCVCNR